MEGAKAGARTPSSGSKRSSSAADPSIGPELRDGKPAGTQGAHDRSTD